MGCSPPKSRCPFSGERMSQDEPSLRVTPDWHGECKFLYPENQTRSRENLTAGGKVPICGEHGLTARSPLLLPWTPNPGFLLSREPVSPGNPFTPRLKHHPCSQAQMAPSPGPCKAPACGLHGFPASAAQEVESRLNPSHSGERGVSSSRHFPTARLCVLALLKLSIEFTLKH